MVTDYNVTDMYNDECYNNYYEKKFNWNKYYENLDMEEDDGD